MAQGRPVVFVAKNGMAVTYATNGRGMPISEATNRQGIPVVVVAKGGIPVVQGGGVAPAPAGYVYVTRVRAGVTQYAASVSRNNALAIHRSA